MSCSKRASQPSTSTAKNNNSDTFFRKRGQDINKLLAFFFLYSNHAYSRIILTYIYQDTHLSTFVLRARTLSDYIMIYPAHIQPAAPPPAHGLPSASPLQPTATHTHRAHPAAAATRTTHQPYSGTAPKAARSQQPTDGSQKPPVIKYRLLI